MTSVRGVMVFGLALVGCGGGSHGATPAAAVVAAPSEPADARPAIAVTIDDLPWSGALAPGDSTDAATARVLAALAARRVPATGFVVCDRLDADQGGSAPILARWRAAGHPLGNHSSTHRAIDRVAPPAWEADVRACRDRLRAATGQRVRWFRFPYLQSGATAQRRDEARQTLAELGHEPAPVSVDTSEWALVAPYVRALAAGDAALAQEIGRAYVDHLVDAIRHAREVAQARVGREVAHVLLLHANALLADHVPALLEAIEAEGLRFVTLDDALADPVYAQADGYAGPIGMSWLYRIGVATPDAWRWDDGQRRRLEARFAASQERARPEVAAAFAAEGVGGAMVVLALPDEALTVHDPERSARALLPASTFKIVNALIALETGVAPGPDLALPWDGVRREVAAWNQDHTLASAFTASAVWYFQELARRIGATRMAAWVARLGYGNRDVGGGIDRFWLDGALAISPREQVDFLRRLNEGRLPVSARTREIVRELMVLERTEGSTLRGKTGWARRSGAEHGWFVGWVEVGARTVYFATLVDRAPEGRMLAARRAVTERALAGLGLLP